MYHPYENYLSILKEASEKLGLDKNEHITLLHLGRESQVIVSADRNDGTISGFNEYEGHHPAGQNPTKDRIHFQEETKPDEKKALTAWIGLQCAIADIPYHSSSGRMAATGYGISVVTMEALKQLNFKSSRIAIQGIDGMGGYVAEFLYKAGYKIVAVSDVSCGIYKADGLHITEVRDYIAKHRHHSLEGYGAEDVIKMDSDDFITWNCDVLIPCALENQITAFNAGAVRAKLIVEGANGTTTADADEILNKRGVLVVPDILANAGSAVVSYFESINNLQNLEWNESDLEAALKKTMTKSYQEVKTMADESKVSYRIAAYMLALKRLSADAIRKEPNEND